MARTARSSKVFSSEFVKAIKTAVSDHLQRNDLETCVSAETLATHKAVAKAFKVTNVERLRVLIMTAVSAGQVPGLDLRKGRNGGVHRVKIKASRKPVAKQVQADATPQEEVKTAVSA